MAKALFIELWAGLRDRLGDNNTPVDINDSKRFINWTMRDLSQKYDWEFLRGTKLLTASAGSSVYDLSDIIQLEGSANTIYIQSDATADGGSIVTMYGKQIAASSTLNISSDPITIIGSATATGGITYSHLDSIRKAVSTGTITVTNSSSEVIATLSPTETYLSNDINKINFITDTSNLKQVRPYDESTYERGNPNGSNLGNFSAYDMDHEGKLRLFNVDTNVALSIIYQRIPRWLINDYDRSEFSEVYNARIINACYEGYGLSYRDQASQEAGKARYDTLLGEIVSDWKIGKDQPVSRVMPTWYKRRL